jgi:tripartite-type tricarboxylate transporter receptor subunit TctC
MSHSINRRQFAALLAASTGVPTATLAQNEGPVRLIVGYAPGGPVDTGAPGA